MLTNLITQMANSLTTKIRSVLIDITNICNYQCGFCWYHLNPKYQFLRTIKGKPFFFPINKLKEFLDDLERINTKAITITSEGEPTLHPKIKDILQYISKKNISLALQTNGTYPIALNDTIIKCVNNLYINLSFITKECFELLNPKVLWQNDKVIANINYIKKKRNTPKITIIYILNKANLCELDKIIDYFNRLNVDSVEFKACEILASINDDLMLNKAQARAIALYLLKHKKICNFKNNINKIVSDLTTYFCGNDHFKNNPKIKNWNLCWLDWKKQNPSLALCESDYILRSLDLQACFYPLKYLYLRLNGNIYTCPRNSWIDPIGNIFTQKLTEILESTTYKKLVGESIFDFDLKKPKWLRCKNCHDASFQRLMLKKIKITYPEIFKKIQKKCIS